MLSLCGLYQIYIFYHIAYLKSSVIAIFLTSFLTKEKPLGICRGVFFVFVSAVDHLCDFVSEVFFSLLKTLALIVTVEVHDLDLAAESLCGVGNVL